MEQEELREIISQQDVAAFQNWLKQGGDPNTVIGNRDPFEGSTLLSWILMDLDEPEADAPIYDMVKLLVEYGVDVNALHNLGDYSPLYWVVTENRPAIARLLLDAGAEVDFRTDTGDTPLTKAMIMEYREMVELLVGYATPEVLNKWGSFWGSTPLGIAFREANLPMIEVLLRHGADPYAYEPDQVSTIHNIPEEHEAVIFEMIERLGKLKR